MSDIEFGRLEEKRLRNAWAHEEFEFTPWLAQNTEHRPALHLTDGGLKMSKWRLLAI